MPTLLESVREVVHSGGPKSAAEVLLVHVEQLPPSAPDAETIAALIPALREVVKRPIPFPGASFATGG